MFGDARRGNCKIRVFCHHHLAELIKVRLKCLGKSVKMIIVGNYFIVGGLSVNCIRERGFPISSRNPVSLF